MGFKPSRKIRMVHDAGWDWTSAGCRGGRHCFESFLPCLTLPYPPRLIYHHQRDRCWRIHAPVMPCLVPGAQPFRAAEKNLIKSANLLSM